MNRIFGWKQNKNAVTILKAVILALLPLACCTIYCAVQGYQIRDVYLPSTEGKIWNDELFYYKQVESILNYGYPLGYFGYNESHALKFSFGAWSPVLVSPWVIWGKVFGWNLMSPVICNIVLMSLSCFLFVLLAKPTWKQLIFLTLFFCIYTPFVRYMLSGMSEIICASIMILFYSVAVNYLHGKRRYKLFLLFFLSGVMTLMRPYLALFLFLPAFLWIYEGTENRRKHALESLAFMAVILGAYALIGYYLGAAYMDPLYYTDWISAFFSQGLFDGILFMVKRLYLSGREFIAYIIETLRWGEYAGIFYAGYAVCLAMLLLQFFRDWRRLRRMREEKAENAEGEAFSEERCKQIKIRLILETHLLFSFLAMLLALLLMYPVSSGGRHLGIFIAAAIFVMTILMDTRFYVQTFFAAAAFIYIYIGMAHYQIPFAYPERVAAVNEWQSALSSGLVLDTQNPPDYENVVIWALGDMVNGKPVETSWQLLYALPKGFGISCCTYEYVLQKFDSLQSRYIYVAQGGNIEDRCSQAGYVKIMAGNGMVLYQKP